MTAIVASIGGVDLRMHTDNPIVRDLLLRRMAGFTTSSAGRDALDVHFDLEGREPIFVCETELRMQRNPIGGVFFEAPGGRGEVSEDNSLARLSGLLVTQNIDAIIRLVLSRALLACGALLIHASAVIAEAGMGIAFVGPSGAGKSTIAETLPLEVLSDEAVVIGRGRSGLELRGTPYWYGRPRTVPLGTIFFIERGAFAVEPLFGSRAAARLFAAAGPLPESSSAAALDRAAEMVHQAPNIARLAMEERADIIGRLYPLLRS